MKFLMNFIRFFPKLFYRLISYIKTKLQVTDFNGYLRFLRLNFNCHLNHSPSKKVKKKEDDYSSISSSKLVSSPSKTLNTPLVIGALSGSRLRDFRFSIPSNCKGQLFKCRCFSACND